VGATITKTVSVVTRLAATPGRIRRGRRRARRRRRAAGWGEPPPLSSRSSRGEDRGKGRTRKKIRQTAPPGANRKLRGTCVLFSRITRERDAQYRSRGRGDAFASTFAGCVLLSRVPIGESKSGGNLAYGGGRSGQAIHCARGEGAGGGGTLTWEVVALRTS